MMDSINMTSAQLQALQAATQLTYRRLVDALVKAGKYNWQAFGGGDGPGQGISQASCHSFMRQHCPAQNQAKALMMGEYM